MILERFRLDGQVAIVTGGTRGIGLGIAEALGEAGARVIVSSRAENAEAMARMRDAGIETDFVAADMQDSNAPQALIDRALELAGRLDILVNNAGIARDGDTADFPDPVWDEIMTTNLDAVFRCSRAALKPMLAQGGGAILNIGSISGFVSNVPQQQTAYNASKAAVHMMTKTMASELADRNIRVNAIAPGYIVSDMTKGGLANPERADIWRAMTPMGRPGTPEEVAAAALYLVSPAASYVTGTVLVIDGGYMTR